MRKLAAFLVIGGLAVGLPGLAMAADIVSVQCDILNANSNPGGMGKPSQRGGYATAVVCSECEQLFTMC
jgi:hypothetical protein